MPLVGDHLAGEPPSLKVSVELLGAASSSGPSADLSSMTSDRRLSSGENIFGRSAWSEMSVRGKSHSPSHRTRSSPV